MSTGTRTTGRTTGTITIRSTGRTTDPLMTLPSAGVIIAAGGMSSGPRTTTREGDNFAPGAPEPQLTCLANAGRRGAPTGRAARGLAPATGRTPPASGNRGPRG